MEIEDYNKYYIQGSDHYLIPKDVFKELFNEMINWKEETKELKKQLKEYKRLGFKHLNDKCNKLENQQKEFIEYMNKTIEEINCLYENGKISKEIKTFLVKTLAITEDGGKKDKEK